MNGSLFLGVNINYEQKEIDGSDSLLLKFIHYH